MQSKASYAKINMKAKSTYLERQRVLDKASLGKADLYLKETKATQMANPFTQSKMSLKMQKDLYHVYDNGFVPSVNPETLKHQTIKSSAPSKQLARNIV